MKKLQILIIAFLISASICAFASLQVKAQIPSIFLSPTTGYVGSTVTVSGSGFAPNSAFSATLAGSSVTLSGTATTDGSGNIPSGMTFTVPFSASGAQQVVVTDSDSNSASATFTITPSISLNSTSGSVGDSVATQ